MTDFTTFTRDELVAKRKWYVARGDKFADQIAAIDAETNRREQPTEPDFADCDDSGAQEHAVDTADTPEPVIPRRSVVAPSYKAKYKAQGDARSCGDWLAQTLAAHCNDVERKLVVPAFEAILTANGIKHEHWNRTTAGWQGRLRMTGRMALARVVVERGALVVADVTIPAPDEWVFAHGG